MERVTNSLTSLFVKDLGGLRSEKRPEAQLIEGAVENREREREGGKLEPYLRMRFRSWFDPEPIISWNLDFGILQEFEN